MGLGTIPQTSKSKIPQQTKPTSNIITSVAPNSVSIFNTNHYRPAHEPTVTQPPQLIRQQNI